MRSAKPLVSVIIPTYNSASFLPESISSVLKQTYKNVEVIVIDDGSTDKTSQLVKRYPVRYIRINRTGGPATPRNVGIREAKGELIAFLDADDVWLPGKLKKQVDFMQRGKFDLISSDAGVINIHGGKTEKSYLAHLGQLKSFGSNAFPKLYQVNFIITSSVLVKKRLLTRVGLFNQSSKIAGVEDYDLWLRIAASGAKFGFLPQYVLLYREHSKSHSDVDEIKSHDRLLTAWRKNSAYAQKVLGGEAKFRIYELLKYWAKESKERDFFAYLRYKILSLIYYSPNELKKRGIPLWGELKYLIRL